MRYSNFKFVQINMKHLLYLYVLHSSPVYPTKLHHSSCRLVIGSEGGNSLDQDQIRSGPTTVFSKKDTSGFSRTRVNNFWLYCFVCFSSVKSVVRYFLNLIPFRCLFDEVIGRQNDSFWRRNVVRGLYFSLNDPVSIRSVCMPVWIFWHNAIFVPYISSRQPYAVSTPYRLHWTEL